MLNRRKMVSRADLEALYPQVPDDFWPTHRVFVFDWRTKDLLKEDLVDLKITDEEFAFGWVPAATSPSYYVILATDLWKSLETHGRVVGEVVRYEAQHVPTRDRLGWVYFVQVEEGPIKIGWSQNVNQRLGSLQIGCPGRLTLLGTIPGKIEDELELHKKFDHLRIGGEWFQNSFEIHDYMFECGAVIPL